MELVGRRAEREAVEDLLERARSGNSGALVVRGEAGIGKTAVLGHARAVATAAGFRVEGSTGIESESQFAFGGLHQLCLPMMGRIGALPPSQQAALSVAFGQQAGAAPERFLVGLAVLNLLAEVAEDAPLLGLVDDAQWLDQVSAQVLAFVARRLAAERMGLVFAVRDVVDDGDRGPFAGLPELSVGGLRDDDARELLAATLRTPLDEKVRDRIVAESRGNPLALLELPRLAPQARLAGGFELPDVLSVPRRIEDSFRQRSRNLPAESQLLLLLAAAEPTGDPGVLWRAAQRLEIEPEASEPAETAGLLEIDRRVRFRHPLVRSAIYQAAATPDRRRVHGALAAATDSQIDPDRRAWHRARAVLGTDEPVAAEVEGMAGRARARGGLAAAAAFLRQATDLTPDPARRGRRALAAAHVMFEAGDPMAALELLAVAAGSPLDELHHARLELLRAQIAFYTTRGSDAPTLLLNAARSLAPLDAALSRETYLQALQASIHAGRLGPRGRLLELARAAQDAPAPPTPPRAVDLLLDGLATRFTDGFEASVPALQEALRLLCHEDFGADDPRDHQWLWVGCQVAAMLWDDESIYVLANRGVGLARAAGALAVLPGALNALSTVHLSRGDIVRAAELAAEEQELTRATGAAPLLSARLILAAWRGRRQETLELSSTEIAEATARGEGATLGAAELALASLHNGVGNFAEALAAAAPAVEHDELTYSSVAAPELIEAAVRAGHPERVVDALEQLVSRARASGTPWALGVAARSRALMTTGPGAEEHYREAIERFRGSRSTSFLARAQLIYGEWLRREGRRRDAREQLRAAHQTLAGMGAEAFAERAARELRATGEHPRKRAAEPSDELTAQELQIARLVATGATSREVAAQLFLSPRTIEAHLRNIFRKLGITSRRQIRDLRLS